MHRLISRDRLHTRRNQAAIDCNSSADGGLLLALSTCRVCRSAATSSCVSPAHHELQHAGQRLPLALGSPVQGADQLPLGDGLQVLRRLRPTEPISLRLATQASRAAA